MAKGKLLSNGMIAAAAAIAWAAPAGAVAVPDVPERRPRPVHAVEFWTGALFGALVVAVVLWHKRR